MRKSKTVLIGAGNMGKNHAHIYSDSANFCAISDINKMVGKKLAMKYGVQFFQNYKEMIDTVKPDAVSVVVPTKYHYEVASYCLTQRVPTLLEKPIASSLDEATKLIELSKKYKTFLMIGHIERFNPVVAKAKELINDGELGEIIHIRSERVGIMPPKIPHSDVGLDLGIHDVDLVNFFLNSYPISSKLINEKVFNQNISDITSVSLQYTNNILVHLYTSWMGPIKRRTMNIIGTKASIELDFITQKVIMRSMPFTFVKNDILFNLPTTSDPVQETSYAFNENPLKNEIIYFFKHMNGPSNEQSLESALKSLEVFMQKASYVE